MGLTAERMYFPLFLNFQEVLDECQRLEGRMVLKLSLKNTDGGQFKRE